MGALFTLYIVYIYTRFFAVCCCYIYGVLSHSVCIRLIRERIQGRLTKREIIVMPGDRIFVCMNPYYSLVKEKLKSLRTEETNNQTCKLVAVQSNAEDENSKLAFGGNLSKTKRTPEYRASMFGRTASAVFRMVMLKAVQIPENHWPDAGERTKTRNKNALEFTRSKDENAKTYPLFELLNPNNNTKKNARKYWRHYDQMFPHFLIEDEVLEHKGRKVPFENTMFILRESTRQVIEITTKACATMYPPSPGWKKGEFDCEVQVSCICKKIIDEGEEGEESEEGEEGEGGEEGEESKESEEGEEGEENRRILNELRAVVDAPRSSPHVRRRSDVLRSLADIE